MNIPDETLTKLLLDNQFVSEDDIKHAQEKAKQDNSSLQIALTDLDLISEKHIGQLVADFYQIPFIPLQEIPINVEALKIIPEKMAQSSNVIAFDKDDKEVKIATSNPQNTEVIENIKQKVQMPVKVYLATDSDLKQAYSLYKNELQCIIDEMLHPHLSDLAAAQDHDIPVAKIVDTLIEYAYINKTSDIHIEPQETSSLIRFRIDGILHDIIKLPKDLHEKIISRIKVQSKLRTDEHFSAQDGKMQLKMETEDLDIRVSIVPIVEGEKCVMRLLTSHFRAFGLADIGMNDNDRIRVEKAYAKPYGMILSTGPTGSGKSTTMYAILKILNIREKNIATIEDPVEYDIQGINQIQVNPKTNLTFAEGLRSILRQDPDIIYVGEIRDEETADIAINSAMTGHLVLSTLHTNDAATSLPRMIDMGIEPFLVSSTINVIVAQRLVRKICEKCKMSYTKSKDELTKHFPQALVDKSFGPVQDIYLYKGKGCGVCHNTGYTGRVGIFEVLEVSDKIQEMIINKERADLITQQAILEGMTTMVEDGLNKVQQGVTNIEEVLRATKI